MKYQKEKKSVKKVIAAILAVALVLCTFSACSGKNAEEKGKNGEVSSEGISTDGKKTGDIIEFGSYPQSRVTDEKTVSALEGVEKKWVSYEYYSGTGDSDDGKMKPSDYMKYADIDYNGEKYRAVSFSQYRPNLTYYESGTSSEQSKQYHNGYKINTTYYFRYEPLEWRVLDAKEGLIVCNSVIDSQAYNNYSLESDMECYGDSSKSYYANNWPKTSIRKWLNEDFYSTAFSSDEQAKIVETALKTPAKEDSRYDSPDSKDKVFLLTYDDTLNSAYGFTSDDDPAKQLKPTDYAQCQGCSVSENQRSAGNSPWWMRTPYCSYFALDVLASGSSDDHMPVCSNGVGVVPALKLN